ncbi:hypothetical protein WKV44_00985 [Spirochaetia bacterium 38H-sp]|uniref:Uncharacterized protein n=1 Tax=Rarispira pelagica TaxID=3141764 RepID=A0ABU9U8W6_9SPIR
MSISIRILYIVFILFVSFSVFAKDIFLQGKFSVGFFPLSPPNESSDSMSEKELATLLLEEARWVYSGMVFGFSFSYVPYDKTRKIEEVFSLEPIAEIKWGDPFLSVMQTWTEDKVFYAMISYTVPERFLHWYEHWQSANLEVASGIGTAPAFEGYAARKKAVEEAVKQAVREHERARVFNKPRLISGTVALRSVPVIRFYGDRYRAQVDVVLEIKSVKEYRFD